MDQGEVAARANELPDRFRGRLHPDDYGSMRRLIRAGEWGEGLTDLIAALLKASASITPEEHAELSELMIGINLPTDELDRLTVR